MHYAKHCAGRYQEEMTRLDLDLILRERTGKLLEVESASSRGGRWVIFIKRLGTEGKDSIAGVKRQSDTKFSCDLNWLCFVIREWSNSSSCVMTEGCDELRGRALTS